MNQQLIQTSKATILVVDLPEGATSISPGYNSEGVFLWYKNGHRRYQSTLNIEAPWRNKVFEWQLLGKTFDLSEEQWECVVPRKSPYSGLIMFKYMDYNDPKGYRLDTATESGLSLLTANKVYRENPYSSTVDLTIAIGSEEYHHKREQWQAAEQHVFKNAYTLIKR